MRTLRGRWVVASSALAGAALVCAAYDARADEPRNASEPRVMMESGEVTNVIDAFDDGHPFDVNLSLGFSYSSKSASILRETNINAPGLSSGGYTSHLLNVATYSQSISRLTPRVDVGVYKDIAFHITLPIILSNSQSLTAVGGTPYPGALAGTPGDITAGQPQLFSLPFNSPTRSGVEHLAMGFDFDVFNQTRDHTKPTWQLGFEGRFSVGTPMHACNTAPAANQVQCADPSDVSRSGSPTPPVVANTVNGPVQLSGNFPPGGRDAGVTRGTIALELHTLMSRRMKYIEPYGGFSALFEFQEDSSDYGVSDLAQTAVNHPPFVGTMTWGLLIIPWENRERFSRITFDVRAVGQYHSEGRDYSELFDALGSSAAPSLRLPNWAAYQAGPNGTSVVNQGSQMTYTTGLTDVLAYASLRGSASVLWQASKYIKFQFGMGYKHDQPHVITGDVPCSPGSGSLGAAGPCQAGGVASGVPNPNYRVSIDEVGRRFWVGGSDTVDVLASTVVMF
jgi:hypothetical protein